ncbi:MAG: sirohydrochlorin cobaltochelatase, partial [Oscillospiraceae bacterium]
MKTGILIVSFGTTHLDTLAKTIQAVEENLASAFPGASCYRAFTSGIVRSRLKSKYDITVDSVEEALTRMQADGVKRAVVQPTLLIPGEEYDRMRSKVLLNAGEMEIAMGLPLLWDDSDLSAIMEILERAYPQQEDTVLLAMGHGTEHESNCLYVRLAQRMKERGG